MIVEDQLDGGVGRIGGIDQLEEFDELAAAVAVLDERVDPACQQVNSNQQAEGAMTPMFKIARKRRMDARHGASPAPSSRSPGSQASRVTGDDRNPA